MKVFNKKGFAALAAVALLAAACGGSTTEGKTLMQKNLLYIVARARFGGQLETGSAAAIVSDAQA